MIGIRLQLVNSPAEQCARGANAADARLDDRRGMSGIEE